MARIILVTGGNRGIGLEICRQLSAIGHTVFLGSHDPEKGKKAATLLEGKVIPIKLDVTNEQDIKKLAANIDNKYGKLDVLINNAGIMSSSRKSVSIDLEEVRKVMEINFFGAWRLSQIMLPLLKKSHENRIIEF